MKGVKLKLRAPYNCVCKACISAVNFLCMKSILKPSDAGRKPVIVLYLSHATSTHASHASAHASAIATSHHAHIIMAASHMNYHEYWTQVCHDTRHAPAAGTGRHCP